MPSEQQNEQEIQFKKRARRRLVGAVALVLLMVTILPMILDDRAAKTTAPDIEISIPSQDNVEESKTFTSKVIAAPAKEAEQQSTPTEVKPIEHAIAESAPEADKKTVISTDKKSEALAEQKPKKIEVKKAETTEVAKPEPEKVEVKKADSVKEESSSKLVEPNAAEKSASGFMVQIGVFSSEENVKQLQQKLKDKGFSSSTEKIQTPKGEKIRLRVGPFADKDKAEQGLASIKGAGMSGMVVSH